MSFSSYYTTPPNTYTTSRLPPNGTLLGNSTGLRKLDAAAIITCLLLLRLAFSPPDVSSSGGLVEFVDSNVGASIDLAFYGAFRSRPPQHGGDDGGGTVARPMPLDIDGDGVVDALVVPTYLTAKDARKEKEVESSLLKPPKGILSRGGGDVRPDDAVEDATVREWGEGAWGLRVLNLKPLHSHDDEKEGSRGPFSPRTMFLSSPLSDKSIRSEVQTAQAYPLKLIPIQIPMTRTKLGEEEKSRQRHRKTEGYGTNSAIPPKDDASDYDRTRHYFCGRDWHHAAQSCHRHCGGGLSSECAEGESCYADTPCDVMLPPLDNTASKENNNSNNETEMALTVRGTLPGISTVWSDGSVTLHVITADVVSTGASSETSKHDHRGKRDRQRKKKPELEMRLLWRVFPLSGAASTTTDIVRFEELALSFESGVIYSISETSTTDKDGNEAVERNQIGSHGAILFGGRYITSSNSPKVSFHALDALTGAALWDLDDTDFPIPIIHTTSSARRRSHLPVADTMDPELDNENSFVEGDNAMTSEECMAHFRASVLDDANGALPHEFWDGELGSMSVGRFERAKKPRARKNSTFTKKSRQLNQKDALFGRGRGGSVPTSAAVNKPSIGAIGSLPGNGRGGAASSSKSWQTDFLHRAIPQRLINRRRYDANHPRMGKPNVVIFHGRDGLAVLSLKNGRPVCHVSLIDNALYADIDRDGVVDVVQVVTSPEGMSHSEGIQSLVQRIDKAENRGSSIQVDNRSDGPVICHALVTSGLPPREEVFTAPLCLGGPLMSIDPKRPQVGLRAAPPLLIEGSLGYGNDVVFAMNNGVIVRYDSNGREVWRKKSAKDGTPTWHSSKFAFLGRVQFGAIKSHSSVSASSHRNQHRPGSPVRPILISGEDGAAVISPASGKVLSSVVYPQTIVAQPLLADLNGDGTDDLLVVSADAVWGYRILVETGRSGFFSIVVVTLVVGVALAALLHKTSQTSRRSMDA
ncbi:hypothetical protein ACHAWX_004136 [Stephanocyclus meneghinianus]